MLIFQAKVAPSGPVTIVRDIVPPEPARQPSPPARKPKSLRLDYFDHSLAAPEAEVAQEADPEAAPEEQAVDVPQEHAGWSDSIFSLLISQPQMLPMKSHHQMLMLLPLPATPKSRSPARLQMTPSRSTEPYILIDLIEMRTERSA